MKYIIIGAGVAGVTAAKTIHKFDPEGEIILIGEENYLPYRRYLLTEFLCNTIIQDNLFYDSVESLEKHNIKFRKGEYVKSLDAVDKTLKLHHNEVLSYDKLLISAGGCPRLGPVLAPFARHIQHYYTLEDILVLKEALPDIKNCVVCGEGISALDLMSAMKRVGVKVTYITKREQADFPLVETEFENGLHQFLEENGIEIITNDRIIAVDERDDQYEIETYNKKRLKTDIVFAWDHYSPNITFIENTGIEKKDGILVNTKLQTTVEDIYAAGDCVEIYHPQLRDYWINFGWPNALEQGKVVGRNMTGKEQEYRINETVIFNLMGKPLNARWWE
jgi:NADPH-dependent 2,4-dienoyl-CoA reductase/sulfur reductase-like enzyme